MRTPRYIGGLPPGVQFTHAEEQVLVDLLRFGTTTRGSSSRGGQAKPVHIIHLKRWDPPHRPCCDPLIAPIARLVGDHCPGRAVHRRARGRGSSARAPRGSWSSRSRSASGQTRPVVTARAYYWNRNLASPVPAELQRQFSPTLNAHINKIGKFDIGPRPRQPAPRPDRTRRGRGRRGLPLIENRHFCSVAKPRPT